MEKILKEFIEELNKNDKYKLIPAGKTSANDYEYNIYNEISLQHELGKFLEEKLEPKYKIFYEKNIYDNKKQKDNEKWVKKEVDIVIISTDKKHREKYAIELKFSKGENARTPENMFDYIKDIKFMEQVKEYRGYTNVFNFIIANSQKYYKYELNNKEVKNNYNIYEMFRIKTYEKGEREFNILRKPKNLYGYCHPTGNKKEEIPLLNKNYSGKWKILMNNEKDNPKKIYQYRYILINHNKA